MSKFVKVRTELRDVTMVKQALDDLHLRYDEHARYDHAYSNASREAALLVRAPGATFGLQPNADGVLEVMADDMAMHAVSQTLQRVQQRYAYHMVRAEVEKAGFDLVEEQTGRDQVIRMTVRRWG